LDGGGLSPLGLAAARHVADRRHRAPGGGEARPDTLRASFARAAGRARRALAATSRDSRAPPLASLPLRPPQRAAREQSESSASLTSQSASSLCSRRTWV